jgi:hypothetical protein
MFVIPLLRWLLDALKQAEVVTVPILSSGHHRSCGTSSVRACSAKASMRRQGRRLETSVSRSRLLSMVCDGALLRCGSRGSTPRVTPFVAPFAPLIAPFMAPFAPFLAAFHACGLSLGIGCRDHRCRHCRTHGETQAQE